MAYTPGLTGDGFVPGGLTAGGDIQAGDLLANPSVLRAGMVRCQEIGYWGSGFNPYPTPTHSAVVTIPVADSADPTSFGGSYYGWYMGGAAFGGSIGFQVMVRRSPGFSVADANAGDTRFYVGLVPANASNECDGSLTPQTSRDGWIRLAHLPDTGFVTVDSQWSPVDLTTAFPHGAYVVIGLWNDTGANALGLDVIVDTDGLKVGTTSADGGSTFSQVVTVGQIPYAPLGGDNTFTSLPINHAIKVNGGVGKFNTEPPAAASAITGALSAVTDAAAKAVLTSIIAALTADGGATDGTS